MSEQLHPHTSLTDTKAELTIIVPIYNEIDGLDRLQTEMSAYLSRAKMPSQVLFVNDGSIDGSLLKIQQICTEDSRFSYISFDKNYGLSAAIKAGIDHIDTTWTGYIDADLQTSPEDFNILQEYAQEYDLVTGVRAQRKDSFSKRMSSKIANSIRRAFTNDGMDDTGCPLKIMKSDVAKRIPMFDGLHRFFPAMVLLQKGKIIQIPVQHFPRIQGQSKFNMWNRLLGPLMDCFAYLWMKKKYINYQVAKRSHD